MVELLWGSWVSVAQGRMQSAPVSEALVGEPAIRPLPADGRVQRCQCQTVCHSVLVKKRCHFNPPHQKAAGVL